VGLPLRRGSKGCLGLQGNYARFDVIVSNLSLQRGGTSTYSRF